MPFAPADGYLAHGCPIIALKKAYVRGIDTILVISPSFTGFAASSVTIVSQNEVSVRSNLGDLQRAAGIKTAVRIASHYNVEGVVDGIVLALSKFSSALNPSYTRLRAAVALGRDLKACTAMEALFYIANRSAEHSILQPSSCNQN